MKLRKSLLSSCLSSALSILALSSHWYKGITRLLALQRFGPGCWKEIKENEPALANRSTVQIKDKVVESSNIQWPQAPWIGQFPSLGIYALPLWGLYSSHAMPSRVLFECLCDAIRHGAVPLDER
jgi:hypothetical protein